MYRKRKYYIDFSVSEYNIVKDPTLPPMSGRKHSDESKQIMSDTAKKIYHPGRFKKGENHPNYGKKVEGSGSPSQAIEVTDIKNNITTNYGSIREAARALNIHKSVIDKYFSKNQKKPYKGQYTFIKTK